MAAAAPAGTVTEAGTTRAVLLLDKLTAVPPLGAACASATVQVELAPEVRLAGTHCSDERPGSGFTTVTTPEPATTASGAPIAKAAEVLPTLIGTDEPPAAAEKVSVTVAATPSAIVVSLAPPLAHITEPDAELHDSVLPALPRLAPPTTLTEVTSPGAYDNCQASPAGDSPLLLSDRFNETDPPGTAEPEDRLKFAV